MPTVFSHVAVPLALGLGLGKQVISGRLLTAGLAASAIPDLDVLAFRFGIPYADSFGHRGATHSLAFAALAGFLAFLLSRQLRATGIAAFAFVAVSAASHGILDMFTNGGHGVALWWPLSDERLFAPWQVIEVSPLSVRRLLSAKGLEVMTSELVWVWLPCIFIGMCLFLLRLTVIRALSTTNRRE